MNMAFFSDWEDYIHVTELNITMFKYSLSIKFVPRVWRFQVYHMPMRNWLINLCIGPVLIDLWKD